MPFIGFLGGKKRINKVRKGTVMEMVQNNKLKMAQATRGCLQDENNAPLWAGIGGIEEGVESLGDIVDGIVAFGQKQTARTGFAAQKKAVKKTLLDGAWAVCCGLQSLASKADNSQLAAQVKFSRSTLARGREQDFVNRCQSLLALGTANAAALAEKYNVPAADLEALDTAITGFGLVQSKPRNGRAAKSAATKRLEELFANLDKTLNNQLDPLIEKFRSTNAEFYNEYQAARSIVDSAATHETKPENSLALPSSTSVPLDKAA